MLGSKIQVAEAGLWGVWGGGKTAAVCSTFRVQRVRHSQSTELLQCGHLTDTGMSLIMTSAGIWVSEARVMT